MLDSARFLYYGTLFAGVPDAPGPRRASWLPAVTLPGESMKRLIAGFGLMAILAVLVTASGEAAPLGIALRPFPDIFVDGITITYDAGTSAFTATGFAETLDDDGGVPAHPIAEPGLACEATSSCGPGSFALTASI